MQPRSDAETATYLVLAFVSSLLSMSSLTAAAAASAGGCSVNAGSASPAGTLLTEPVVAGGCQPESAWP